MKQLEIIEKNYVNTTIDSTNDKTSFTDRIIEKIITFWSSSTANSITQSSSMNKEQQSKDFETAAALLEKSARDYDNNDALLLLAELNFVSVYHI